jgi:hypothetical protein
MGLIQNYPKLSSEVTKMPSLMHQRYKTAHDVQNYPAYALAIQNYPAYALAVQNYPVYAHTVQKYPASFQVFIIFDSIVFIISDSIVNTTICWRSVRVSWMFGRHYIS